MNFIPKTGMKQFRNSEAYKRTFQKLQHLVTMYRMNFLKIDMVK